MRVLHERCCGLDIHKKFVVACLTRNGIGWNGQQASTHLQHHDR
jgi:hypothetical protein